MNTAFKVMFFSMALNFAVGLLMIALPFLDVGDTAVTGIPEYQDGYTSDFTGSLEDEVNPSGNLEDKGDSIYRVLDMVNLGFITRFINGIKTFLFGFIEVLHVMVGPLLTESVRKFLFGPPLGVLHTVMILAYLLAGFFLWTGKDVRS